MRASCAAPGRLPTRIRGILPDSALRVAVSARRVALTLRVKDSSRRERVRESLWYAKGALWYTLLRCPHRLVVRTPPFQGGNASSSLAGGTRSGFGSGFSLKPDLFHLLRRCLVRCASSALREPCHRFGGQPTSAGKRLVTMFAQLRSRNHCGWRKRRISRAFPRPIPPRERNQVYRK